MKCILKGVGTSAGISEGMVRIIRTKEDRAGFQDGDILVTEITDPSMVSLMSRASAIVCDIGSITSHPSIVSRELGIPCVVATKNGTRKLKNGMRIRIDGKSGEIFLVE
jgi:pyruvate,water dikinase